MLIMQASANSPTLASSREKFFWSGIWIYSLATGLASMIFMAWAFYVESVEGRGALFIEPNRVLAADADADCYQDVCVPEYVISHGRRRFHSVHFFLIL